MEPPSSGAPSRTGLSTASIASSINMVMSAKIPAAQSRTFSPGIHQLPTLIVKGQYQLIKVSVRCPTRTTGNPRRKRVSDTRFSSMHFISNRNKRHHKFISMPITISSLTFVTILYLYKITTNFRLEIESH